jgi:cyclophilin family peptidyl-prolyl cis-trans isomerase
MTALGMSQHSRRDVLWNTGGLLATSSLINTLPLLLLPSIASASYIDPDEAKITKQVFLDIEFEDKKGVTTTGTLVIGLYGDIMPKAVDNFVSLCSKNEYAGTTFYRVVSDFSIQGGAIGDPSGRTGRSSFGDQGFEPDNYNIKHNKKGLVSMVKATDGTADSRFFINCNDNAGWADDRYAAIGIVLEGMDLVQKIEQVPVQPPKNNPKTPVKIVKSGVV